MATSEEGGRRVRYGIFRQVNPWGASPDNRGLDKLVVADEQIVDRVVGQPYTGSEYCSISRARLPRRRRLDDKASARNERDRTHQEV